MGVTEGGCVANGRLGHGVSMVSENARLAHLFLVFARGSETDRHGGGEGAPIEYPGRLRRSVEGVGVL